MQGKGSASCPRLQSRKMKTWRPCIQNLNLEVTSERAHLVRAQARGQVATVDEWVVSEWRQLASRETLQEMLGKRKEMIRDSKDDDRGGSRVQAELLLNKKERNWKFNPGKVHFCTKVIEKA